VAPPSTASVTVDGHCAKVNVGYCSHCQKFLTEFQVRECHHCCYLGGGSGFATPILCFEVIAAGEATTIAATATTAILIVDRQLRSSSDSLGCQTLAHFHQKLNVSTPQQRRHTRVLL